MSHGPDPADIMAALPMALIIVDQGGTIAQINAGAEIFLNASAAHLIGRSLASVITLPLGFDLHSDVVFAAYDVHLNLPHHRALRADFVAAPIADYEGWRLVTLHGGATAHRMGQRAGGSGARTAVGVAAMLAHEIKNPLSGIRGAAQLLGARAAGSDAKLTSLICTEVDRVTALIDRMEGFTDTRTLPAEPENIHIIIDHALRVAKSGFAQGVIISDSFDPSLPPVLIHRDSLVQILLNLLKNAVEAASGTPAITITTAYRHGVSVSVAGQAQRLALPIELCVIDDGPGAPSDIADTLFDPFVSSKKSGRGLGLALVDKLVRDMGGIIQYAREDAPQLTVFRLLLPRADRKQA
jgi:two-component system, NtrC family, nitrogen regulation sensor histidine kinase GlnL